MSMAERPLESRRVSGPRHTLEAAQTAGEPVIRGFPLLGEPLALDLANTRFTHRGREVDLLPAPAALAEWLALEGERIPESLRRPDRPAWAALIRLRRHIEACLEALLASRPLPPDSLAAVNRAAAAAPLHRELDQGGDGRLCSRSQRLGTPAQQLAAIVAESAVELLAEHRPGTIRQCDGDDCELVFISPGQRRRWCSPAICGNRARVARFYRRHRRP